MVGGIGIREVAEDAHNLEHALGLERARLLHEGAPTVLTRAGRLAHPVEGAIAGQPGVHFEVHASGVAGGPGCRGDLGEGPALGGG